MSNIKSYELIFIWILLRIVDQETTFLIVLRNYSKEAEEEDSVHVILVKGVPEKNIHLDRRLLLVTRNKCLC